MAGELQRQGSTFVENGYFDNHQSLRLRRMSSRASTRNYPQYNWNQTSSEEDESGNTGPSRELRSIPYPMEMKRAMRQVQQMQVPVGSRAESWKWNKTKSLRKLKNYTREFLYFFSLWGKSLQKIGGNFGGGVQSYFLLLRFLVVLNFFSFLLIGGFVIIPSIVLRSAGSNYVNSSAKEECAKYDPNPQGLVVFYDLFLHVLSGTGFMEYSFLFYGYYNNTRMENDNLSYNTPLAYLFTSTFYFAFCLICIVARMGAATRVAVATGSSTVANYSMMVFTGWDYSCLGEKATKLKQKSIHYRLQVDLEEEQRKKHAASLTLGQKVLLHSLRVFMFFFALGLYAAAFYCIYEATNFSQKKSEEEGILGLFFEYLPSIVITAGNFLVPLLCDQIALAERYSPSTTVIVALLRAVFLRLASLGVLLYTLWDQITCGGDLKSDNCNTCNYNHKQYPCWETRIGQEMYKLTLFDLLINIAMLVLVEFPRRMVVDNWSCKLSQWIDRQEFVVPSNVLGLVYGQTVVWAGAFFCPLLPLINTIKFVIVFYCKKTTLFYNCRPAQKTFRSTTSTVFFLLVLAFGWTLALVVMIYGIAVIHPSEGCGPFRSLNTTWAIVASSFKNLTPVSKTFLFYIGSQAFSIPLFASAFVAMCYFIALASVYGKNVDLLSAQLKLVGQDKKFLVKQIELSRQLGMSKHSTDGQD